MALVPTPFDFPEEVEPAIKLTSEFDNKILRIWLLSISVIKTNDWSDDITRSYGKSNFALVPISLFVPLDLSNEPANNVTSDVVIIILRIWLLP